MSFVGKNLITKLNYFRQEIGRKIKSTKSYYLWEFNLNGIYHRIEFLASLMSGLRRLIIDNEVVDEQKDYSLDYEFEFKLDNVFIIIKQIKGANFGLYIENRSFNDIMKEESEGKNKALVEKKLQELKNNNNISNLNNKNNNKYLNQNFDIVLDDNDDILNDNNFYENNEKNNVNNYKNKNIRNDDDFYKSNGNDLDFSDKIVEKNKQIISNINFFDDNDKDDNNNLIYNNNANYNINNNYDSNSNYNINSYNNINNFNMQNNQNLSPYNNNIFNNEYINQQNYNNNFI